MENMDTRLSNSGGFDVRPSKVAEKHVNINDSAHSGLSGLSGRIVDTCWDNRLSHMVNY